MTRRQNYVIGYPRKYMIPGTGCRWCPKCHVRSVFDPLSSRLEHYMDLLSARQKLVAGNIANADTPGYRTKDIDFQFEFQSQLAGLPPDVRGVEGLRVKNDGNDVSMDRETRLLAENAIRFNMASAVMKGQLKMLRSAIEEGK